MSHDKHSLSQGAEDTPVVNDGDSMEPVPCPFCGGKGHLVQNSVQYVKCEECEAQTKVFMGGSLGCREVLEAWNMRARKETDK